MKMEKLLRDYVREFLLEEIGRDLETTMDSMHTWRNLPGVHVNVTGDPGHGGWVVNIEDDSGKLTSKFFKEETEANHYARQKAFEMYRKKVDSGDIKSVPDFGPMMKGSRGG
jgi:hypothetical protein